MRRLAALALVALIALAGCAEKRPDDPHNATPPAGDGDTPAPTPGVGKMLAGDYVATIQTTKGTFKVDLWEDKAPVTVANFLQYAEDGHYANTVFHRVIKDFMNQAGGFQAPFDPPTEKDTRPGIPTEIWPQSSNKVGTVAMARVGADRGPNKAVDSATSQFFVNVKDNTNLDRGYTVFGNVVDGMDVVFAINNVQTSTRAGFDDVPVDDVVIQSVTIERPTTPAVPSLTPFTSDFGVAPGSRLSVALYLKNVGGERLAAALSTPTPGVTATFSAQPWELSAGQGQTVIADLAFDGTWKGGDVEIVAKDGDATDTATLRVKALPDGPAVGDGSRVRVKYVGLLDNGLVFDTNEGDVPGRGFVMSAGYRPHTDPLPFTIGAGDVIPGFEKAAAGLKVGETRTVRLTSDEGYRDGVDRTFQMTVVSIG